MKIFKASHFLVLGLDQNAQMNQSEKILFYGQKFLTVLKCKLQFYSAIIIAK